MTKKATSILLCLALVTFVMAACNLRPKPVTIKTYVINTNTALNGKVVSKPFPYTLILPPIIGALPFRTQKILYRSSDITLGPYLYSRWEYAPTHMLMVKMINILNKSGLFRAVTYRSTGAQGNLYLETTLLDFSHHLSPTDETSFGMVSAIFNLVDGKTRNIIATKTFTVKKPTPSVDAEGVAAALNAASDELCLNLVAWLRNSLLTLSRKP